MKKLKFLNKLFMAFAKGAESVEGPAVVRYTGVAACKVVGMNPTKKDLEAMYNTTLDSEPEYVGEMESNGNKVPYARVTFLVKPDPKSAKMDVPPISISLFIRKEFKFNKDNTKIQVIDEYGNSGWATKEECQAHSPLMSKDGNPIKISTNYRPAYIGEIELTEFLRELLAIPAAFEYVNKTWQLKKNADMSVARLEHVENLFKGDFSEVSGAIALAPDYKVRILFGVRKNDEGKMYQAFFKDMFLRNGITNYSKLDEKVQMKKQAGAYPTTDFEVGEFKVYSVAPTDFSKESTPFDTPQAPAANPWFS